MFFFEKANFINTSKPWYEKYQAREQELQRNRGKASCNKPPTNPNTTKQTATVQ
jgi:hypothetical protein